MLAESIDNSPPAVKSLFLFSSEGLLRTAKEEALRRAKISASKMLQFADKHQLARSALEDMKKMLQEGDVFPDRNEIDNEKKRLKQDAHNFLGSVYDRCVEFDGEKVCIAVNWLMVFMFLRSVFMLSLGLLYNM